MRLKLPVVLASGSPRRRELLATLVPQFDVVVSSVDEEAMTTEDPFLTAESLAVAKARAVLPRVPGSLVIGGDTVVALPTNRRMLQLAKPTDVEDAVRMLLLLSGREHLVITGYAIAWDGQVRSGHEVSRVLFRRMDAEEAREYALTGEPMDKAGAYAVQGGASKFVERLDGSFSNVMGLPLERLEQELAPFHIPD